MFDKLLLTVLGTADLHGHMLNWDYLADQEFDHGGEKVGLAAIGSLVRRVRKQRQGEAGQGSTPGSPSRGKDPERILLLDAGDTIGGTQLTYYYARVEPITETRIHPMAVVMNALGYDAAVPGNHDFDYGVPLLRDWQRQLSFPLLAANVFTRTGEHAFRPYLIRTLPGDHLGPIRVGILGLTNPGTAVWNSSRLAGELTFPGLVEQARVWVPRIRRAGADVVLVVAHSGIGGPSSYAQASMYPENASELIAAQVPGVDAVLAGHTHEEIDQRVVTNERTGDRVVITEPWAAGRRLSVIELELTRSEPDARSSSRPEPRTTCPESRNELAAGSGAGSMARWLVTEARSYLLNANTAEEDPRIVRLVRGAQQDVVRYVNTSIGTSTTELSGAGATCRPSVVADLVNVVQADAIRLGLRGTEHAGLPVLSLVSPCTSRNVIPAGMVAIRHIAALYPFDNLLLAVRLTGAQLREYLEASATYFRRVDGVGPYRSREVTNAPTQSHPSGAPDYYYDVLGGWGERVQYDIDIASEPGARIRGLCYGGKPIAEDATFVVAVNDHRQAGGGSFPHISRAPVVYDRRQEVRQLLIEWVLARGRIEPSACGTSGSFWRLVAGSEPVQFIDD